MPLAALMTSEPKTKMATINIDRAFLGSCMILTRLRMNLPIEDASKIANRRIEPAIMPVATSVMERAIGTSRSKLGRPMTGLTNATTVAKKGSSKMRTMVLAGTPTPTAY